LAFLIAGLNDLDVLVGDVTIHTSTQHAKRRYGVKVELRLARIVARF
jgi:hypothetical protein